MSGEKNIVRDHPEFPFGDTLAVERLDQWEQSFDPAPEPESPEQAFLRSSLEFLERYVFLEKVVQGEIRYELPVHPRFLEQREHLDDPLEQQAAELAEAERMMLGFPDVPSIELLEDLEDTGIKIVFAGTPSSLLPESPRTGSDPSPHGSVPASTDDPPPLTAGFFFDGEVGPAFLLGIDPEDPRAAFVLAHLLGHLIADHDPYQNRVCRWHPETLENLDESPSEVRADLFARALLVPEGSLHGYLEQLGNTVQSGESRPEDSWRILQTLFGVPEAVLYDRLLDRGLESLAHQLRDASAGDEGSADRVESVPSETGGIVAGRDEAEPPLELRTASGIFLPERFLNLALACYHERVLEEDVLGMFLGLSEVETRAIVEWSQVGRCPEDAVDEDLTDLN